MRLPRRVPWASLAEFEHVCSSIYSEESDIDAKIFAINRISAWREITALPHAVESTLALLVVIVQDSEKHGPYPILLLRQSYATAILRLVNGLVDPLQVGTYARSISSIAQQLGLPSWLVELRHAATHEDLPSINHLREASRQSMAWLLHNYYLPTLNPPLNSQDIEATPLRLLLPVLKSYKGTMKAITRDVSLVPKHRSKLITVLRDLERWIAECKVAANVAIGEVGWTSESGTVGPDVKEIWALERFCDGLAGKGMLVPLSKKKRQRSDSFQPSKTSISFWELLLRHIQSIHVEFPYVLCRRLLSILLSSVPTTEDPSEEMDLSYDTYLASWVKWTVTSWGDISPEYYDLKKSILSLLLKGLSNSSLPLQKRSALLALSEALSAGSEEYETLIALLSRPQSQLPKNVWDPQDLDIMNERHRLLQHARPSINVLETYPQQEDETDTLNITGWRILADPINWKPCPIGVYYLQDSARSLV